MFVSSSQAPLRRKSAIVMIDRLESVTLCFERLLSTFVDAREVFKVSIFIDAKGSVQRVSYSVACHVRYKFKYCGKFSSG